MLALAIILVSQLLRAEEVKRCTGGDTGLKITLGHEDDVATHAEGWRKLGCKNEQGTYVCRFNKCRTKQEECKQCKYELFQPTDGCKYTCSNGESSEVKVEIETWKGAFGECNKGNKGTVSLAEGSTNVKELFSTCEGTVSLCTLEADNAEVLPTVLYYWNCKKCHTSLKYGDKGYEAGDFYALAPFVYDKCCEECEALIKLHKMNQYNSPEFLVCGGCKDPEDAFSDLEYLEPLDEYVRLDSKERLKPRKIDVNRSFNGLIKTEVIIDQKRNPTQFNCTAKMYESGGNYKVRTFGCSKCGETERPKCCSSCQTEYEKIEKEKSGDFLFCDCDDDEIGHSDIDFKTRIIDDANKKFGNDLISGAAICQWSLTMLLLFAVFFA